jgi:hypothetical protein
VAPLIALLSLRHWYDKVPEPVATTEKLAVPPSLTDCDEGSVVMVGAVELSLLSELLPPQPANRAIAASSTAVIQRMIMGTLLLQV